MAREGRSLPEATQEWGQLRLGHGSRRQVFGNPPAAGACPGNHHRGRAPLSPGPGCHAAGAGWAVPGAAGPREAAPGPLLFVEEKQTRWRWPSPSALRWCEGAASGCEIPATSFHGHPRSMHNMFRTKDQRGWLNRAKTHRTWTPGSGLVWASMSGKDERGVEP